MDAREQVDVYVLPPEDAGYSESINCGFLEFPFDEQELHHRYKPGMLVSMEEWQALERATRHGTMHYILPRFLLAFHIYDIVKFLELVPPVFTWEGTELRYRDYFERKEPQFLLPSQSYYVIPAKTGDPSDENKGIFALPGTGREKDRETSSPLPPAMDPGRGRMPAERLQDIRKELDENATESDLRAAP